MLPEFSKITANSSPFKTRGICLQRYSLLLLMSLSLTSSFFHFYFCQLYSGFLADSQQKGMNTYANPVRWVGGGLLLTSDLFFLLHLFPARPSHVLGGSGTWKKQHPPSLHIICQNVLLLIFPNPSACGGLRGK